MEMNEESRPYPSVTFITLSYIFPLCVDAKGYSWEGELERSWDAIEEDESGRLKLDVNLSNERGQR